MPRLHIKGVPVDRYRMQRRIVDERVMPLSFPLDPDTADHLIDIEPDDSWLPLAIALAERMHRLWSLITLQPTPKKLVPEGEHLYLTLHASLVAMIQGRPQLEEDQELLNGRIPNKLPSTLSLNDNYQDNYDWTDDGFEAIRSHLFQIAVQQRLYSDTRTVTEVMSSFDRAFDRVQLAHYEQIQARIESLHLTDDQKTGIRQSLESARKRADPGPSSPLAMALEVLGRIEQIWTLLFDSSDLQRFPDDESTYQAYRMLLVRLLHDIPNYQEIGDLARSLLPRQLPKEESLHAEHPDLVEMPARIDRVRSEIVELSAWLQVPTLLDHSREPDLDGRYEEQYWEWEALEDEVEQYRSPRPPARTVEIAPVTTSTTGRGRREKDVPREDAARAWWKMRDLDERKNPSDIDIALELSTPQERISARTIRRRRAAWNLEGPPWPGPRPKDP